MALLSTVGCYDDQSGVFFSSDCFGAVLANPPLNAADLSDSDLREGQVLWATADSPWVHKVDEGVFAKDLDGIRKMEPSMVLSSHLPAARGDMTERLIASLAASPKAQAFPAPDQAALEQMLKAITDGPPGQHQASAVG